MSAASLREAIFAATAQAQEREPPAPGFFLRGGRLCLLTSARSGWRWLYANGEEETGGADDFRERAIERVPLPQIPAVSYLDGAWQIAGARTIEPSLRIAALGPVMRRGPDQEQRAVVAGWIRSLAQGVEPKR